MPVTIEILLYGVNGGTLRTNTKILLKKLRFNA
jgi:hypothetical protein